MLVKNKLVKLLIFIGAGLLLLKVGVVSYRFFAAHEQSVFQEKRGGACRRRDAQKGGYGFGRMIPLIEASRKVKELEHLYFVSALEAPQVERQTIRDLIKSLTRERFKLRRHVDHLKSQAGESISTKKMRSFAFYLRVLEENIQDLEIILTNRVAVAAEQRKQS